MTVDNSSLLLILRKIVNIIFLKFREVEDAINILCHEFDFDRNTTLKYIDSKNWRYLIQVCKAKCDRDLIIRAF